jgi:hypothetical protein
LIELASAIVLLWRLKAELQRGAHFAEDTKPIDPELA